MHIIIFAVLIAAILYWYFALKSKESDLPSHNSITNTDEGSLLTPNNVGFISKGKLFIARGRDNIEEVHSPYISDAVDRMERSKKLHGWKQDTSLATSFTGAAKSPEGEQVAINFSSALFCSPEKMLYFLKDANFGGMFEYNLTTGEEKRLLHQQKLDIQDLARSEDPTKILGAQHYASGLANVVMIDADGHETRELTAGDTVDAAPAWVHDQNAVVYQSSGLARSEEGYVIAQGPSAIQMLDLQTHEIIDVVKDNQTDYLQPKVAQNGNLFYIRRPYDSSPYKPTHVLLDTLFFPFRLLRAVFHYLNFFSLMYTRKPLTSASGPKVEADLKEMLVKGKRIDAENALRKEQAVGGVPSLVPKSWQLICRSTRGDEQVLATNVASYHLDEADNVIYSNGYGVFQIKPNGGTSLLFRDTLINEIIM